MATTAVVAAAPANADVVLSDGCDAINLQPPPDPLTSTGFNNYDFNAGETIVFTVGTAGTGSGAVILVNNTLAAVSDSLPAVLTYTFPADLHPATSVDFDALGDDVSPVAYRCGVLGAQTISFTTPAGVVYGASVALGATAPGGPVTYVSTTTSVCTVTPTGTVHTVATGTCSITDSQSGSNTYIPTSATESFSISPAPLTITANNQTKVYGAALPVLSASYGGLVNGDTSASIFGQPILTTTATSASHVSGSPYTITPSGAVDANYTISYMPGSLTVTTAPLTITANNAGKLYGAALPVLSASYGGFVNGDTTASLTTTPTLSTTATSASHVSGSPYAITPSGAVDPDYTISYQPGSLSVTPAPLTITADSMSKVYGAAVPALTASYSGFVNGDTTASLSTSPTISTTATATSPVAGSPYPITASGAVDADYTIGYGPGSLTVTAATQTITFLAPTSIAYGAPAPQLSASASSGLPVTYSVTSGPCTIDPVTGQTAYTAGGTCVITVSQAGNGNVSAATPVSQNLVITGAPTALSQVTGSVYGPFSAKLTTAGTPLAGQTITFTTGTGSSKVTICTATTRSNGVASCTYPYNIPITIALALNKTFTATYAGTSSYLPMSATGQAVTQGTF